jgi:glucose/arabinose dehydrogenase
MFQSRSCWRRVYLRAIALLMLALGAVTSLSAATLPAGFTEALVASGLSNPTAMQFAPDGRIFVAQQGGALRVIKNGALLATPFLTVSVDANGERGLLGVAFDPNFASNQYVYVYYTVPGGAGVTVHNRISRFTANGDVAAAGSEVVVVDLDNLSGATNHNGGAIDFGPDGKLYVAVGDNANNAFPQSLSTRHGKMLRLNADGSIPTDNPFYGTASGANRAIWALGLRNPFTFALNPGGSPAMLINDVGQGSWEEVNPGTAGANFGWPTTEGDFNPATHPTFTRPRYAYPHSGGSTTGCAITGGAFYTPGTPTFPTGYQGMYFFADFCSGWIKYVDPTVVQAFPLQATAAVNFASGVNGPVDLKVWTDGALYYLARGAGAVYRVQYGNSPPTITAQPVNRTVSVGQSATFSVTAGGTPPFTYQWQRNGANISGATSASYTRSNVQLADSGARFRVNVSNGVGNLFSNEATLTVTTNVAPVAAITAPATNLLYTGGMTVAFAGTGTDPDGAPTALPASAFSWRIDFHHDTHFHPFLPATSGITGGTFVVPTTGETSANVWYRLYLTVTDSGGLSHTVQRDIFPRKVRLTLAANPAALQLRLDGQPVSSPTAFDSVVGMQRTIEAPAQTVGGVGYAFTAWSDGGAASRAILTPGVATTYTASFTAVSVTGVPTAPGGLTSVVNGATVRLSWNRAVGAQGYRLEAGTQSGLADLVNADMGDVTSFQGLVPPGTYFVRVRGVNAAGVSAPSGQVTVVVSTTASCVTPPPVPTGFTAQTGGLLAALSWSAAPGATGYVLDVGRASGLVEGTLGLGPATTYQTLAPAGSYFARLRARNACGTSGPSVEVPLVLACSATAVVPGTLSVTKAGGAATFSWLPPLGATGYRLRVGTVQGASDIADIPVGTVTALAVPLGGVPPRTYYVRVVAESACGIGAASNEVALTVP